MIDKYFIGYSLPSVELGLLALGANGALFGPSNLVGPSNHTLVLVVMFQEVLC